MVKSFRSPMVAVMGSLLLCTPGCVAPIEIGEELIVNPVVVPAGGKAVLMATVFNAPLGTEYFFSAVPGSCDPGHFPEPTTTLTAPLGPGTISVRMDVMVNGKSLKSKAWNVKVGGPASTSLTPTNAPRASQLSFSLQTSDYLPSGWMGDAEGDDSHRFVQFDRFFKGDGVRNLCEKWTYTPGPKAFAAVAWQFPERNFGEKPGRNLSQSGFTKLSFHARGAKGGETVEFFAGGNTTPGLPYQASFPKTGERLVLTKEWTRYTIPLNGMDLSNVTTAFGWSIQGSDALTTFFIDAMKYEP